MSKFKTIRDRVNVYDIEQKITKALNLGTIVDIIRYEYDDKYGVNVTYGFISENEFIITEWNGEATVEKVPNRKKKGEKADE